MKRSCHLLVSLMLSALIVLLSVGISFVDCCHKNYALRTTIACMDGGSYGDDCGDDASSNSESYGNCCDDCPDEGKSDCGCAPQTSCVTVTVAKLAPFGDCARTPVCFVCPMAMLPWAFVSCPSVQLAEAYSSAKPAVSPGNIGSPPRARLLFLGILRI